MWRATLVRLFPLLLLCATVVLPVETHAQTLIKIDGSSTVFPITEAVAEEYQSHTRGATRVTVGISGTGGGFKKFCRGEIDIQDASRPISAEEMAACTTAGVRYVELPIAFDAITIVVSPKNTWAQDISIAELKKLWEPAAQKKVTTWKQVRASWPEVPIKLFGAGADSGTFDYFTEAVMGKAKASRGDYTASEDDNTLVLGVAGDTHALGYLPFSYYQSNARRLRALPVRNDKASVAPTLQTIESSTYAPLSRPVFIYVSVAAAARPEVKGFVEFYLNHAASLTKQVGYVPLPADAYVLALQRFRALKQGTVFGGHSTIGMTIQELLQREGK